MKSITFSQREFKTGDGTSELPYTEKALLRAVVAAGRDPDEPIATLQVEADIQMRINALRSALDMGGSRLLATREFQQDETTIKSIKSFYIGNALCAHAASERLQIPWLVDFKKAENKIEKEPSTNKRPDFLGIDKNNRRFIFESKGRSTRPGPADYEEWKKQARSVKRIDGQKVEYGVVSSGFLNSDGEWELVWVDPPADETGEAFTDRFGFFAAYYDPIAEYIMAPGEVIETAFGPAKLDINRAVYVGLHRNILTALLQKDTEAILSFASTASAGEIEDETQCSLFADGMIVKLGPNWDSVPLFRIEGLIAKKQQAPKQKVHVRSTHWQTKLAQQHSIQRQYIRQ